MPTAYFTEMQKDYSTNNNDYHKMKKNLGSTLALYPTPAVIVGTMVEGKVDYNKLKPVLFEMPTYSYLKTGEVIAKCTTPGKEYSKQIKE